jgi:hypothetical protein
MALAAKKPAWIQKMLRHPPAPAFVAAPAPRLPTLHPLYQSSSLHQQLNIPQSKRSTNKIGTYNPPTDPPRNANPLASALYFKGSTSDGIVCTIEIVESVVPIKTPPPINIVMDVALAETTAPAKEIRGGIIARYFLSSTSESRPMIGERTLCMRSGPYSSYYFISSCFPQI